MNENLKQELRSLRTKRLINYSNVAYQRISYDWYFESVPSDLINLWYCQDNESFITLSIINDSDIDHMSYSELISWIEKERYLIARLENIFSNLENRK